MIWRFIMFTLISYALHAKHLHYCQSTGCILIFRAFTGGFIYLFSWKLAVVSQSMLEACYGSFLHASLSKEYKNINMAQ